MPSSFLGIKKYLMLPLLAVALTACLEDEKKDDPTPAPVPPEATGHLKILTNGSSKTWLLQNEILCGNPTGLGGKMTQTFFTNGKVVQTLLTPPYQSDTLSFSVNDQNNTLIWGGSWNYNIVNSTENSFIFERPASCSITPNTQRLELVPN